MDRASESVDFIFRILKRTILKKSIEYYMCPMKGNLNNLANIMILGDHGLTGFTNNVDGYIVGIKP